MRHQEIKELLPAYVLGAVPEEELREIRNHVLSCEECMQESEMFAATGERLAVAAAPIQPPPGFMEKVMREVQPPARSTVRSLRHRRFLLPVASALAGAAAVGLLSVAWVAERGRGDRAESLVAAMLSEPAVDVRGSGVAAALVESDDGTVFVGTGFEGLSPDEEYQLWVMEGDCVPDIGAACSVTSPGTFLGEDGLAIVEVGGDLEGVSRVAVTVEPAGGSEGPTSAPLADSA